MTEVTEAAEQGHGPDDRQGARGPSRSLAGVVAALLGLLVLAVVHYGPGLTAPDPGLARLEPGLFEPEPAQRGVHDLGDGVLAGLFLSGLRVDTREGTVLKTTEQAAPVMVLTGTVSTSGGRPSERLGARQEALTVDGLQASGDRARWTGVATRTDGSRVRVVLTVERTGTGGFSLGLSADQPVDGFAVPLDPRYTDVLTPPGDARRTSAWWADGAPVLDNPRLARSWRLAVSGGRAGVDRRTDGATMLHVWGSAPTLTFTAPTVGS